MNRFRESAGRRSDRETFVRSQLIPIAVRDERPNPGDPDPAIGLTEGLELLRQGPADAAPNLCTEPSVPRPDRLGEGFHEHSGLTDRSRQLKRARRPSHERSDPFLSRAIESKRRELAQDTFVVQLRDLLEQRLHAVEVTENRPGRHLGALGDIASRGAEDPLFQTVEHRFGHSDAGPLGSCATPVA